MSTTRIRLHDIALDPAPAAFVREIVGDAGLVLVVTRCDRAGKFYELLEHWPPPSRASEFAFITGHGPASAPGALPGTPDWTLPFANPFLQIDEHGRVAPMTPELYNSRMAICDDDIGGAVTWPEPLVSLEAKLEGLLEFLQRDSGIGHFGIVYDSGATPLPPKFAPADLEQAA